MQPPFSRALHALAVDDAGRRARCTIHGFPALHIERVMNAIQRAIPVPKVEITKQRAFRRQVFGNTDGHLEIRDLTSSRIWMRHTDISVYPRCSCGYRTPYASLGSANLAWSDPKCSKCDPRFGSPPEPDSAEEIQLNAKSQLFRGSKGYSLGRLLNYILRHGGVPYSIQRIEMQHHCNVFGLVPVSLYTRRLCNRHLGTRP